MLSELRKLESRLQSSFGAWNHYRLRLWQQCRSVQAAGVEDRIRIASTVIADPHRGESVWAWGGFAMLLDEIQRKLNDPDPHIRQDAAVALSDFGLHARDTVPLLLDRLITGTIHERTLAAWALPRIGAGQFGVIPALVAVLNDTAEQTEADELRYRAAEAVEALSDSFRTLVPLARRSIEDRHWKVRLFGLTLVERLGKRSRRILDTLMPNV